MKKSTKIALAVLALILIAALLLVSVPVPLLSMLSVPEGESWQCEVMQPEGGVTVLAADRTQVLVRRMEHVNVRFRGWTENYFTDGWAYLHHIDAADGQRLDTIRFYLDEQGLLWVDDLKFALTGEDGAAFREALEEAIAAP